MPTTRATLLLVLALQACGDAAPEDPGSAGPEDREAPAASTAGGDRPAERVDTLLIEGMAEPITVRLFETPDDFPLRFSAYVPEQMRAGTEEAEDGASARIRAEFGGRPNPDAYIHLFVFPEGTPESEALGVVLAYQTSRGIPVSGGLELLPPPEAAVAMPWALRGYSFRYQGADGSWFHGTIGLGEHRDRLFHIVTHYPAEYGDGFGPRARLILESWRWADGTPLMR